MPPGEKKSLAEKRYTAEDLAFQITYAFCRGENRYTEKNIDKAVLKARAKLDELFPDVTKEREKEQFLRDAFQKAQNMSAIEIEEDISYSIVITEAEKVLVRSFFENLFKSYRLVLSPEESDELMKVEKDLPYSEEEKNEVDKVYQDFMETYCGKEVADQESYVFEKISQFWKELWKKCLKDGQKVHLGMIDRYIKELIGYTALSQEKIKCLGIQLTFRHVNTWVPKTLMPFFLLVFKLHTKGMALLGERTKKEEFSLRLSKSYDRLFLIGRIAPAETVVGTEASSSSSSLEPLLSLQERLGNMFIQYFLVQSGRKDRDFRSRLFDFAKLLSCIESQSSFERFQENYFERNKEGFLLPKPFKGFFSNRYATARGGILREISTYKDQWSGVQMTLKKFKETYLILTTSQSVHFGRDKIAKAILSQMAAIRSQESEVSSDYGSASPSH